MMIMNYKNINEKRLFEKDHISFEKPQKLKHIGGKIPHLSDLPIHDAKH